MLLRSSSSLIIYVKYQTKSITYICKMELFFKESGKRTYGQSINYQSVLAIVPS